MLFLSNLAYFPFIHALLLASQSFMLITSIQIWLIFHLFLPYFQLVSYYTYYSYSISLFSINFCLIFRKSVIYACYSYPSQLTLHFFLPQFQLVSHLYLLLLSNLTYFAFILALFLGSQLFMLFSSIQFGLSCILFLGCQLSMLITSF